MNRHVRRFVLNEIVHVSAVCNYAFSLALPAVHETVKIELEEEGTSFCELPDVFENGHCELSVHSLALVLHHMLPAKGSQV